MPIDSTRGAAPPREGAGAPVARLLERIAGGRREGRLIVRIAELERRLERLEADAAATRTHVLDVGGRVGALDAAHARLRWVAAPGLEDLHVPPGGRAGLSDGGSSRVVCSAGTGPDRELLSVLGAGLAAMAWRWGWDVVLSAEDAGDDPPVVRKLRLIRELCDDHAWVLWVAPHAGLVDLDADVLQGTRADRDLYVGPGEAEDDPPAHRPVLLVRSSDWSRRVLDHLITDPAAHLSADRCEPLDAAWAWRPGTPAERGPYVMVSGTADPDARHAEAVERLARLRRAMAGLGSPVAGEPGFGPRTAADLTDLLAASGSCGDVAVVGHAPDGFCEHLLSVRGGGRVIHVDPACEHAEPREHGGLVRRPAGGDDEAEWCEPGSLDAVWLLGADRELSLTRRLMAFWPMVRPGGLMLGHPHVPLAHGGSAATAPAVEWFFAQVGVALHVTTDDGPLASWVARRPADASSPPPHDPKDE